MICDRKTLCPRNQRDHIVLMKGALHCNRFFRDARFLLTNKKQEIFVEALLEVEGQVSDAIGKVVAIVTAN